MSIHSTTFPWKRCNRTKIGMKIFVQKRMEDRNYANLLVTVFI